jgi:hypothetical protein
LGGQHASACGQDFQSTPLVDDLRVPSSTLLSVPGDKLFWAVIEPAYAAVNIYEGRAALAETMRPLTRGQRALVAVHCCISEVLNGGVHQFLTNPTGVLADEAVAGFRLIGVPEVAAALTDAIGVLGDTPPAADPEAPDYDEFEAVEASDALRARLAPFDDRIYQLLGEVIYPRAAAYVRAHPEEFVR